MKADDLIAFIIEEAQHCLINNEWTKTAESALTALSKKPKAGKQHNCRGKEKSAPDVVKCENCKGSGHNKANFWAKGGGKEGQGPRSRKGKREEKRPEMVAIADTRHNADNLFAFTCTFDYADVTNALNVPKSQLGAYIDSGASHHYSPHCNAFTDYCPIHNWSITTADGQKLKVVSMGNIIIKLPNGVKHTKIHLKDTIYTPNMAFTLISVSRLDEVNGSAIFSGGMCTIKSTAGHIVTTIPRADGLYHILPVKDPPIIDYANVASVKWVISEAH